MGRKENSELQKYLKQSESDAYSAREEKEELLDKLKQAEKKVVQLDEKNKSFRDEISILRNAVDDEHKQKDTKIASMISETKKAKLESYTSKQASTELKE